MFLTLSPRYCLLDLRFDIRMLIILGDETTAWGYKRVRIYVSGKGTMTNNTYGAYLDVTIHLP